MNTTEWIFCPICDNKTRIMIWEDIVLITFLSIYLDDLCVDENYRGKHIGKKLYDAVLELAKEKHCYNVTLNVWHLNESALKFYEKCGMKPLKICMEKIMDKIIIYRSM